MKAPELTLDIEEIELACTEKKGTLMQKLPTLLRIMGAGALVVAMYSFLTKGWYSGNDVFRYLLMLAHTGLLATIGLASGHWLKESKGARLLLTLALVSVPANFAILGALIFSQSGAMEFSAYPSYIAWSAQSLNSALLTTAGALLVLIPVTLIGFTALVRSFSKKMALLFLFSNAALLLPLRDPQWIGLLVSGLTLCCIYFSQKAAQQHVAAKTQEGIIALGLQMLPLAVLMGRSLWLYSLDLFLLTVLTLTCFFLLRQISLYMENDSRLRCVMDSLSLLPALATIPLLIDGLDRTGMVADELLIPLAVFAAAMLVYDISCRSKNSTLFYRHMATLIATLPTLFSLFIFGNLTAALATITVAFILLNYGYRREQRSLFGAGLLLLTCGFFQQLYELLQHFAIGGWASLVILGVIAIVSASFMESKACNLKPHLESWKSKFQGWQA
ncbi:hypothetical protein MNBD_GAMMA26-155 [hydrothermal vent metagenome]|uniref:DUF2157 domain-containing protein n=1 Tax=hydrothermal vent metagenome TaxID=652676 RepID=A0A3B1BEQ1_9ZZZZ